MNRPTAITTGAIALLLAACGDTPGDPIGPDASVLSRGEAVSYATLEVPGARSTTPQGIGPRGDVVGFYVDGSGVTRGFHLRDGEYRTIDFPGAVLTQVRGVGPDGQMVGTYKLPGDGAVRWRSFVREADGGFRDIAHPDHESIMAQRILPDGTILGCVHDADMGPSMKGVVLSRGGHRVNDLLASMHNGATPNGRRIVGLYSNASEGNRAEGYLLEDGVLTPLMVPGSVGTQAWDINAAGEPVGFFRNSTGIHGFVLTRSGYVTLQPPGAVTTRAFGINSAGDVVGDYIMGGRMYGFIARRRAH
jgi:hypothetical protein